MKHFSFTLNAKNRRWILYTVGFIFGFQIALGSYFISDYIAGIIGTTYTGLVYAGSAILSFILMISFSHIVTRLGNKHTSWYLIGSSILAYCLLYLTPTSIFHILLIILYQTANMTLWLSLDIYLEHYERESTVAHDRALYLTLINTGWFLAPFSAGILMGKTHAFSHVFFIQSLCALSIFILFRFSFKNFKDKEYVPTSLTSLFPALQKNKKAFSLICVNAGLQLFYAFMVVYTSLHLVRDIGIDIRNLGALFSIMLIPFVVGGMPVEKILSKSSHPSRVLTFGFFLLFLGAIAPLYYEGSVFLIWALILCISRIGAVILETGAEALFFKVVSEEDIALISTFRLMHPLSYFCAAIIGSSILHFANIIHIFSFVSILMLCMIFFTLTDKNLTSISLKKT